MAFDNFFTTLSFIIFLEYDKIMSVETVWPNKKNLYAMMKDKTNFKHIDFLFADKKTVVAVKQIDCKSVHFIILLKSSDVL